MSDEDNQIDELCVLQSIYTEEEFSTEKNDDKSTGQFTAYINVPEGFFITYKDIEEHNTMKIPVSYLPPIILKFTLPKDYPSKSMPLYEISCLWLTVKKLNIVCKRLDELWHENEGTVILYTWTQFLKEESLEYLGIRDSLDLTRRYLGEMRRFRLRNKYGVKDKCAEVNDSDKERTAQNPSQAIASAELPVLKLNNYSSKNDEHSQLDVKSYRRRDNSSAELSSRKRYYYEGRPHFRKFSQERQVPPYFKDPRIVFQPLSTMFTHQYIAAFNEDRSKLQFQKNIYLCEICFLDKPGEKCLKFHPCNHVYCKDCIKEYFETRIKEGMVETMPCPYNKCNSEASQSQIKEVIGKTLFDKYDDLLFNFTLNAMEDITYCPRQSCGTPVMREADDKLAVCTSCRYVFCVFCKMTYHGVEPCKLKTEEKRKIVEEYEQADGDAKFRMEKRYGKKQLQIMVQMYKSENWLSTNSKACPQCGYNIEKIDGCNKMKCLKCKGYFCWLCLTSLDPNLPYKHFNDPSSQCYNQLYYGTEIEENEEGELWLEAFDEDVLEILDLNGPEFNDIAYLPIQRFRWAIRAGDEVMLRQVLNDEIEDNPNNFILL